MFDFYTTQQRCRAEQTSRLIVYQWSRSMSKPSNQLIIRYDYTSSKPINYKVERRACLVVRWEIVDVCSARMLIAAHRYFHFIPPVIMSMCNINVWL